MTKVIAVNSLYQSSLFMNTNIDANRFRLAGLLFR